MRTMRAIERIGLLACILASGCWDYSLGDWNSGPVVRVCVDGEAGRCCEVHADVCTIFEEGCMPGARYLRKPERCLSCLPWNIDDGGAPARDPFSPPPNPPADAAIFWTDDAGVHDAHIQVCGAATYDEY